MSYFFKKPLDNALAQCYNTVKFQKKEYNDNENP